MSLSEKQLREKAKIIRKEIMKMALEGHGAHISSCLCITDVLTVLYWDVMHINPKSPQMENRDRFILSKGHAVSALYAVLAHRGFFAKSELKTYGKDGTRFIGHPEYGNVPGIEFSTGSLGHGLSVGVGMAYAAKKLNKTNSRSYILLSDAECEEGSVWETSLFAAHHGLDNVTAIVDYNKMQAFGRTNDVIKLDSLSKKWQSFGWKTIDVDGHNIKELQKAFHAKPDTNKPTMIICHTVPAKGVSFMEDKLEWHYFNIDENLYRKAIKSIDEMI